MGFWESGNLRTWDLRKWYFGKVDFGKVGFWESRILGKWDFENMGFWEIELWSRILESLNFGKVVFWESRILQKNSISCILIKNSRICTYKKFLHTKQISWIYNSISLNLFDTGSLIWGITFHNLKYLDKQIKCLEIRANMLSVWKINVSSHR